MLIDGEDVVGTCRRTSGRPTPSSRATRSSPTSASATTSPSACAQEGSPDEIDRRVARGARARRPRGEANRRPNQLSGASSSGSRWRARSSTCPKVLLLDEPLGALDLKLRKGLQVELKRIQREVGITFLYVTHDQEEALTMSDRIAVMNEGRVEQVGGPEDVYERPATTFVAGFIGVSNLMPGDRAEAATGARCGSTAASRSRPTWTDFAPASAATRSCAPRSCGSHCGDRPRGELPRRRGMVESSVYLGTSTQIIVRLGGRRADDRARAERRRGGAPALPGGGARESAGLRSTCTSCAHPRASRRRLGAQPEAAVSDPRRRRKS